MTIKIKKRVVRFFKQLFLARSDQFIQAAKVQREWNREKEPGSSKEWFRVKTTGHGAQRIEKEMSDKPAEPNNRRPLRALE
jgi:hypothetical protein